MPLNKNKVTHIDFAFPAQSSSNCIAAEVLQSLSGSCCTILLSTFFRVLFHLSRLISSCFLPAASFFVRIVLAVFSLPLLL